MPEIALSGLLLDYPYSGTATYTRNLVPRLPAAAPDLRFRLYVRKSAWTSTDIPARRIQTAFRRVDRGSGPGARLDKLAWETVALPIAAAMDGTALIHSLYFAAPFVASAPVVVTIHDVIPLILPDYHRSRQSVLYSLLMARAAKRARAIITVSEHSKRDIVRVLGIPEGRVHVTYEAVDPEFQRAVDACDLDRVRARYALPERYLLYLGGAERRKNVELLVRAWKLVAEDMRRRDTRLVLVARFPAPDPLYPDVRGLIGSLGLAGQIQIVSEVAESDKPAVYRAAQGFCFPSTYEGFGLTPLEAMAAGVPVLAANATSIPETAGSGADLISPHDPGAWGEAMLALVDSPDWRRDLIARGAKRVAAFSWEETARQTAAVYRSVLA